MVTRFHRAKIRRREMSHGSLGHGGINLVPLVDILTSIVFFSLVSYQGIVAVLTSYDLSLPPIVINAPQAQSTPDKAQLNLLLAVRVATNGLMVEHSEEGGFRKQIAGLSSASLDTLQAVMSDIKNKYPQNNDVVVIPNDDVAYDDVIHVLERLKMAKFPNVALSSRARQTTGAAAPGR